MNRLDRRLQAVADAVRPGSVAADVGADHGYLICALVADGKCPRGYASDIGPLPLEAAKRHIREQGLSGIVEAVLSDGLADLPGDRIDDVILAGMGGELIGEILLTATWTRNRDKRFILQPMTRAGGLRRLLNRQGFALLDEVAVEERNRIYTVMTVAYTGQPCEVSQRFAQTGLHWEKTDPLSLQYLRVVRDRLERRAAGMEKAQSPAGEAASLWALAREITERMDANGHGRDIL